MAARSKATGQKSQTKGGQKYKKRGPTSAIEGQKQKSMTELHGIDDLVIQTPELNQPLSRKSSLEELQKQKKDKS